MQARKWTGRILIIILLIWIAYMLIPGLNEKNDLPFTRSITDHWTFSALNSEDSYPARVPGLIHLDLLENKLIPDPTYASNEDSLQWIGERSWVYETRFDVGPALLEKDNIELIFNGLDTHADVYLNDFIPGEPSD
ncbi:MAG: hypothetical protein U5Q03_19440 [Bacteroidota bacterium]|nr:hypothetical protein [Bacteroidota bacterium]